MVSLIRGAIGVVGGELRLVLIYTWRLPCNQLGARRRTGSQLAQNPGHAARPIGTATREVKVVSQA
jgi:hypothetical protein